MEVSLETQNELLDLAAHHLGNISVEEALEPVEVLYGGGYTIYSFYAFFTCSSPCHTVQIRACYNFKHRTILMHVHFLVQMLPLPCFKISRLISNSEWYKIVHLRSSAVEWCPFKGLQCVSIVKKMCI